MATAKPKVKSFFIVFCRFVVYKTISVPKPNSLGKEAENCSNIEQRLQSMDQKQGREKGKVRPKKHLGQHFLTDLSIAERIAGLVPNEVDTVLEIGPGTGVLTQFLYGRFKDRLTCAEIDEESVSYLANIHWAQGLKVVQGDFLHMDGEAMGLAGSNGAVIGNFPYNISSQIVFRVIDMRLQVAFFGGMFQREVAQRFCAEPRSKEYGIPSVLLQTYYHCKYEFTVHEGVFNPPPKVKSGVISCTRKESVGMICDSQWHAKVVKAAFAQRRKTLSNSLKTFGAFPQEKIPQAWRGRRAEELTVEEFIKLAEMGVGLREVE